MKKNNMSFVFNAVFAICITACAMVLDDPGILWWYLLPAVGAFFTLIVSTEGDKK